MWNINGFGVPFCSMSCKSFSTLNKNSTECQRPTKYNRSIVQSLVSSLIFASTFEANESSTNSIYQAHKSSKILHSLLQYFIKCPQRKFTSQCHFEMSFKMLFALEFFFLATYFSTNLMWRRKEAQSFYGRVSNLVIARSPIIQD